MKIENANSLSEQERLALCRRPWTSEQSAQDSARSICLDVKRRGDAALREYGRRFDTVSVETFKVSEKEFAAAQSVVSPELLEAMRVAAQNIRTVHQNQIRSEPVVETMPGVNCWRESRPIEQVGIYVPAGSSPLPSTMLMLGVPAVLAGCPRIIVCSPPKSNGSVEPLVLVAAEMVGVREVYKVGGAQAIAAVAYGTESIPRVEKIFGPGNRYVTAAKQFVSADPEGAAIDLLAGPSELLIIADEYANPALVAADLLSQAEHDPRSQVVLVSNDQRLAERSLTNLMELLVGLPRKEIARQALEKSFALVVNSLDEAVKFSNEYAPEHLIINVGSPERIAPAIRNAGSVFLGPFAPVTAGDYASGTNHTLPTGGTAKWSSGVSVESFQKSITFQTITQQGLKNLAPTLCTLASAEGLEAHRRAVDIRLKLET